MMKLAERKLLINESPFRDVDFLEERKQRRRPHILTFEEEDRVLAVAAPHIRALAVLILETGTRSRKEALSLLWSNVDFGNDLIRVPGSKSRAGERTIPISDRCKSELLRWRTLLCISEHAEPIKTAEGSAQKLGKSVEGCRRAILLDL
jgi:integrase